MSIDQSDAGRTILYYSPCTVGNAASHMSIIKVMQGEQYYITPHALLATSASHMSIIKAMQGDRYYITPHALLASQHYIKSHEYYQSDAVGDKTYSPCTVGNAISHEYRSK